jgi:hypothetical protein
MFGEKIQNRMRNFEMPEEGQNQIDPITPRGCLVLIDNFPLRGYLLLSSLRSQHSMILREHSGRRKGPKELLRSNK